MNIPFDELSRVFRNEVLRYRNAVVLMFIAISLSVVFLGVIWPQNYKAASLILVDHEEDHSIADRGRGGTYGGNRFCPDSERAH